MYAHHRPAAATPIALALLVCLACGGESGDSDAGGDGSTGSDGATDAGDDAGTDSGPAPDGGICEDAPVGQERPVPVACSRCRPQAGEPEHIGGTCATHAECAAGDNGRCVTGMAGNFCSYDECFEDTDCEASEVCLCDGSIFGAANLCVPANCRTNADCGGRACAPSYGCLPSSPPSGWYCRTANDTCSADADCVDSLNGRCSYNSAMARWGCEYVLCAF